VGQVTFWRVVAFVVVMTCIWFAAVDIKRDDE
jgi:hypothetical protein